MGNRARHDRPCAGQCGSGDQGGGGMCAAKNRVIRLGQSSALRDIVQSTVRRVRFGGEGFDGHNVLWRVDQA